MSDDTVKGGHPVPRHGVHAARVGKVPSRAAIVVILPGGKADSTAPFRPWQLANLRMVWLQGALRARLPRSVAFRRVRYRVRGWNGVRQDPVADAGAVLDAFQDRFHGVPVILVGHSMGGRVAVHLAARSEVVGVVALAPWWPAEDAALVPTDTNLVAVHGTADTWTDPAASRRQCASAAERGVAARWEGIDGSGHFLVRQAARWHRLTADAVTAWLSAIGDVGTTV